MKLPFLKVSRSCFFRAMFASALVLAAAFLTGCGAQRLFPTDPGRKHYGHPGATSTRTTSSPSSRLFLTPSPLPASQAIRSMFFRDTNTMNSFMTEIGGGAACRTIHTSRRPRPSSGIFTCIGGNPNGFPSSLTSAYGYTPTPMSR